MRVARHVGRADNARPASGPLWESSRVRKVGDKVAKLLEPKHNRRGLQRADKRGLLPSGGGKRYASAAEAFLVGLLHLSGNAAGSSDKQREATRNDLQSISNDLQRLAGLANRQARP